MASSSAMDSAQQRSAAFDARVEEVKFDRSLINEVVMEYLIREGHTQAATNFAREANLDLNWDANETECMEERATIRNCIHAGKIEEAIERINDLAPEVLDKHTALHFALLRLQLIELIRPAIADPDKHMMAALKFAEENLAPTAPTSPEYLRDLEETMTLLIFQPGKVHPSMAHLLEPDLKRDVAKRVNEAILGSLRGSRRNRLYELVKMREWSEKVAREAKCDIPSKVDIGLDPAQVGNEDSIMSLDGNGHSENVAMT